MAKNSRARARQNKDKAAQGKSVSNSANLTPKLELLHNPTIFETAESEEDFLRRACDSLDTMDTLKESRLSCESGTTDNDKSPLAYLNEKDVDKLKKTIEQLRLELKIVDHELVTRTKLLTDKTEEAGQLSSDIQSIQSSLEMRTNELSVIHSHVREIETHIHIASCELEGIESSESTLSNEPMSPGSQNNRRILMLISVLSGMKAQMKSQSEELLNANASNEQLVTELKAVHADFFLLGKEYKKERALLKDAREELKQLNASVEELENSRRELKEQHAVMFERSLNDLELFRKELSDANAELSSSYSQLASIEEAHQEEIAELKRDAVEAKKAWRSYQVQVEAMKKELVECGNYSMEVETKRDALKTELDQVKLDLKASQNALADAESDIERVSSEFNSQREEWEQSQLGSAASKDQLDSLEKEKEQLLLRIAELESQLEITETAYTTKIEEVSVSLNIASSTMTMQNEQIAESNELIEQLRSELCVFQEKQAREAANLVVMLKDMDAVSERVEQEHREAILRLEQANDETHNELDAAYQLINELKLELDKRTQKEWECTELREEIIQLSDRIDILVMEKQHLNLELEGIRLNERSPASVQSRLKSKESTPSSSMMEVRPRLHSDGESFNTANEGGGSIVNLSNHIAAECSEILTYSMSLNSLAFSELEVSHSGANNEATDTLHRTIEELRNELKEVQFQYSQSCTALKDLEKQYDKLSFTHAIELAQLRDELTSVKRSEQDTLRELQVLQDSNDKLQVDSDIVIDSLQNHINTLIDANSRHLEGLNDEEIEAYRYEIQRLQDLLAESDATVEELTEVNDQLEEKVEHYMELFHLSITDHEDEHATNMRRFVAFRKV